MRKECYLFIWLLVEAHISRWALSASQRQLHSAILCFRADPYRSSRMRLWMSDCSFSQRVLNVSCVLSVDMAGATWNCCRLGARSVCTMQPCTRLQCLFIPRHDIRRVHVCLDVTCHFWQNGRDFYVLLWQHEGETDTEMNPAEKVDPGGEISSAALVGIPTRDLSITSVALDPLSYHRSPPAVGALQSGVANTFFFFFLYLRTANAVSWRKGKI